ncbi:MAG: DUF5018 domain-containing protein [Treponema sp.]|jgi:hypothetical protein|nr:DUF5018 domain-containing protein [Treponema sp.]
MKKYPAFSAFLLLFAACSSPVLEWIENPAGNILVQTQTSVSGPAITGFTFNIPGEVVSIRGAADQDGTIPVKVVLPAGSSRSGLSPAITYLGSSITPPGGTAQGANPYAGSPRDFTAPQVYTVTGGGADRKYTVQVYIKNEPPPAIVWFDLELGADKTAEGVVTEGSGGQPGEIILHVPAGTDPHSLTAKVAQTGTLTGYGLSSANTGTAITLTGDFTATRTYTTSSGGQSKEYRVTVIRDKSDIREITALSFTDGSDNPVTTKNVIISGTPQGGKYPIMAIVGSGTPASLKAKITFRGASIILPDGTEKEREDPYPGDGPRPYLTDTARNFTTPVTYRVSAENGEDREYAVTVLVENNTDKEITAFYFTEPQAVGVINAASHVISVKVPYGTNLSALKPTITYLGASITPPGGTPRTANPLTDSGRNFSSPVTYTVTAGDDSKQDYTVRVTPGWNTAKEITAFSFPGVGMMEPAIIGAVPGADGKIPISVTVSPNTNLGSLSPDITHTGKTISPGPGTPGNFASPVTYTVTAEDGSTREYLVSVHVSTDSTAVITGFVFKSIPAGGETIQAVGSIDQDAGEDAGAITVELPRSVSSGSISLAPTITYIGKSVTHQGETAQEANPFTDSPRTFTLSEPSATYPNTYTVTAANGTTTKVYTVTLKYAPQNLGLTVTFLKIEDPHLITADFNQGTGILTLTIHDDASTPQNSGYEPPYTWVLDGEPVNASTTETTLILHVNSLAVGQHQLVLFAIGTKDKIPYTNTVVFTVSE